MQAVVSDNAIAMTIVSILHSLITVVVGLLAFGAAGLAASSFLPDRRFSIMAAPFFGIALWSLAALALYVGCPPGFTLAFDHAGLLALAGLAILGLLLVPADRASLDAARRFLIVVAIFGAFVGPVVMIASLVRGEPALLYIDGADHPAYSTMADWFRSHPPQMVIDGAVGPAFNDPTNPYISGNHLQFETDPRGGAFAYMALVSMLSAQAAALFSFDTAVAISLIAACLGCAALFSRSWMAFLCLATALLTTLWYDYGHMGFFGKFLSYPLALFSFGVFVSFYRSKPGPGEALVLAMLAAGAGMMHSATVYGLMFTCLAAPFLLAEAVLGRRPPKVAGCALAAFPPLVALVASGTLARPFNPLFYPNYNPGWERIAYLVTDLNSLFPDVSLVPRYVLVALFLFCMVAWGTLVLSAFIRRNTGALALLCGPPALVLVLVVCRQPASIVQLAGFPYPAVLCGGFLLAQEYQGGGQARTRLQHLVVTVVVALVLMHIPRTIGSVLHYTRDADRRQMFSVGDFDRLHAAIGDQEVYIDIRGGNARTIFPVAAEFGRRNIKMAWSPESWFVAGSFRGAPVPPIVKMPDLRLIDVTQPEGAQERVVVETPRYKLLRRSGTSTN
jgi:hypothetical protein